ncbi:MAG TPA: hypothetical protein VL693_00405 [Vicinamibacterales bacterium]|jgi:hypothetical protein|nr:hypothetical protein [Vicinamibacterales bacterium]
MKSRLLSTTVALALLVFPLAYAQTNQPAERFTANAVSLSPEYGTGQQVVEITISRWSPASERARLVTALREKGSDELLKQLQKNKPVGRIRTPDSLGYDLRYAYQQTDADGGRTIVIATDRPIGFWEATNRPRSVDYPFTVIQMKLNRDGTGTGTMSYATRIVAHENNVIELENFASQPIMLNNIKAEPKNATK